MIVNFPMSMKSVTVVSFRYDNKRRVEGYDVKWRYIKVNVVVDVQACCCMCVGPV